MEFMKLGLIILLTGILVVFAILLLLIGIIKLYGTIVYSAQNKKNNKAKKEEEPAVKAEPAVETAAAEQSEALQEDSSDVPGEIIAVIAAAVEAVFGQGAVKIKSVKKTSKRRSAWKSAGMAENTRSF